MRVGEPGEPAFSKIAGKLDAPTAQHVDHARDQLRFVVGDFADRLDQLELLGTGCAPGGMALSHLDDISDPLIDVLMDDASFVTFEFFVTESFTTLGGTFYFDDGNCADTDGMFYMFK